MYVFRILRSGCSYAAATAVYCAAPSIKWGTSIHYRKLDSFLIFASSADRLYLSYPLVPPTNTYSSPAEAALAHPDNNHLVSWMRNKPVLDVGHTRTISGDSATLATLGRNGDIKIQDHRIAKEQCSFEIDNETKVIMFHDRSIRCTCQVFGENAMPFEFGRPRKLLCKGISTRSLAWAAHSEIQSSSCLYGMAVHPKLWRRSRIETMLHSRTIPVSQGLSMTRTRFRQRG